MAKNKNKNKDVTTFLDEEIDLQQQYNKVETFANENKNLITAAVGVITLLVLIIFGFNSWYIPNVEKAAQADMFKAQEYFEKDSFQLALSGDGTYPGFEDIISDHSGFTKAADLANYYAGVCYLNLGNYEQAIDYLTSFGGSDEIVSSMALGATGDAYAQLNQMDKALKYYKKAANNSDNNFTTPMFLMKAAGLMEQQDNYSSAKAAYEQLKEKYPTSTEAANIDKYIARAEAKM